MGARSGELLGPYRLRELVGQGGMGTVYRADAPDGRPVAVKVLRQGAPGEENARRRLAREVDTMRRVHSPYVAEVLDADGPWRTSSRRTGRSPASRWRPSRAASPLRSWRSTPPE
jgi:serine/threonine protein kinase